MSHCVWINQKPEVKFQHWYALAVPLASSSTIPSPIFSPKTLFCLQIAAICINSLASAVLAGIDSHYSSDPPSITLVA
jgi:hypothetical protein